MMHQTANGHEWGVSTHPQSADETPSNPLNLARKIKPQMNTDEHRFSREFNNRSARPTDEAWNLRSPIINVHLRPSAVLNLLWVEISRPFVAQSSSIT
jgi:hypothetical protein